MQSTPFVNKDLIKKVTKRIKNKEFSKFVGSPEENYSKYLDKTSEQIKKIKSLKSFWRKKCN